MSVRENRRKKVTTTQALKVSWEGGLGVGSGGEWLLPGPSGPMTHWQALTLRQDMTSASSADKPGPGVGQALVGLPMEATSSPALKTSIPTSLALSQDTQTYLIEQSQISPETCGLCTRPNRTPRPVASGATLTARWVSLHRKLAAQAPDSTGPGSISCQLCDSG